MHSILFFFFYLIEKWLVTVVSPFFIASEPEHLSNANLFSSGIPSKSLFLLFYMHVNVSMRYTIFSAIFLFFYINGIILNVFLGNPRFYPKYILETSLSGRRKFIAFDGCALFHHINIPFSVYFSPLFMYELSGWLKIFYCPKRKHFCRKIPVHVPCFV